MSAHSIVYRATPVCPENTSLCLEKSGCVKNTSVSAKPQCVRHYGVQYIKQYHKCIRKYQCVSDNISVYQTVRYQAEPHPTIVDHVLLKLSALAAPAPGYRSGCIVHSISSSYKIHGKLTADPTPADHSHPALRLSRLI